MLDGGCAVKNRPTNLIKFSFHHKMVVDVAVVLVVSGTAVVVLVVLLLLVPTLKKCNIPLDGLVNTYVRTYVPRSVGCLAVAVVSHGERSSSTTGKRSCIARE